MEFDFVELCTTVLDYIPTLKSMWVSSSPYTINITFYNNSLEELAPFRAWLQMKYGSKVVIADFMICYNSYSYVLDMIPPYQYIFCRLSKADKNYYSWWRYLNPKKFIEHVKNQKWCIYNNFYSNKTGRSIIFFTKEKKDILLHDWYRRIEESLVLTEEEVQMIADVKKTKAARRLKALKDVQVPIKPGWNKKV